MRRGAAPFRCMRSSLHSVPTVSRRRLFGCIIGGCTTPRRCLRACCAVHVSETQGRLVRQLLAWAPPATGRAQRIPCRAHELALWAEQMGVSAAAEALAQPAGRLYFLVRDGRRRRLWPRRAAALAAPDATPHDSRCACSCGSHRQLHAITSDWFRSLPAGPPAVPPGWLVPQISADSLALISVTLHTRLWVACSCDWLESWVSVRRCGTAAGSVWPVTERARGLVECPDRAARVPHLVVCSEARPARYLMTDCTAADEALCISHGSEQA